MLDPATREARRAALKRTYERECANRRLTILTEEFPRMPVILPIPVDKSDRPVNPYVEDSARIAMHHDDGGDTAGRDHVLNGNIAGGILIAVLSVLFLIACATLLVAMAKWGKP